MSETELTPTPAPATAAAPSAAAPAPAASSAEATGTEMMEPAAEAAVMVPHITPAPGFRRRGLRLPKRSAGRVCCCIGVTLVLIVTALLVATSWVVVGVHQAALVYDGLTKTLWSEVLGPGRYFLGVSAVPLVYDTRVRTLEFFTLCNATAEAVDVEHRSRCSDASWGAEDPAAPSLEMWTSDGQWVTLEASFMHRSSGRKRRPGPPRPYALAWPCLRRP